jgi:hypothetical protein
MRERFLADENFPAPWLGCFETKTMTFYMQLKH